MENRCSGRVGLAPEFQSRPRIISHRCLNRSTLLIRICVFLNPVVTNTVHGESLARFTLQTEVEAPATTHPRTRHLKMPKIRVRPYDRPVKLSENVHPLFADTDASRSVATITREQKSD